MARYSIETIRQKALERGFRLLSPKYRSGQDPHWYMCSEGHKFSITPHRLHDGARCPICLEGEPRNFKYNQSFYNMIEQEYGLRVLVNCDNPSKSIAWECSKGHIFKSSPYKIDKNRCCKICDEFEQAQVEAKKHDLECIRPVGSKKYHYRFEWKCSKGHTWVRGINSIREGHSCPQCKVRKLRDYVLTIKEIRSLIEQKHGSTDCEKIDSNNQNLLVTCSKGHNFHTTPLQITRGAWCRQCERRYEKAGPKIDQSYSYPPDMTFGEILKLKKEHKNKTDSATDLME